MRKCNALCSVFHVVLLYNFVTVILSFQKTLCLALHFLSCSLCSPEFFGFVHWANPEAEAFATRPLLLFHLSAFSTTYPCVGSLFSLIQALFSHNVHTSDDFKFKICTLISIHLSYFSL